MCSVTSVVSDSATPWTVAHQALQSMEFFRQEYWEWVAFPFPEIFHNSFKELMEKAMATHSSTLAWKIPWTEEPGGL